MKLQMQKILTKDSFPGMFTSASWTVDTQVGEVILAKVKERWSFSMIQPGNETMKDYLEKRNLTHANFATRKEAIECLETYLEEDGLL